MKEKKITKEQIVLFISFTVYIAINLICVFHHECWRDEAQAWLLARDKSVIELLRFLHLDGNLFLWIVMLMPLAKMGLPIITENILSFIIVSLAVFLLYYKTTMPMLFKIAISYSSAFLYFTSVIARPYCLTILMLVLLLMYYDSRIEKPFRYHIILCLLSQTHIIMLGFVSALLLTYYIEIIVRYRNDTKGMMTKFIPSFIVVVGEIAVILQMSGASGNSGGAISCIKNCVKDVLFMFPQFIQQIMSQYKDIVYSAVGNAFCSNMVIVLSPLCFILMVVKVKRYWCELLWIILGIGYAIFVYQYVNATKLTYRSACSLFIYIFIWAVLYFQTKQRKSQNIKISIDSLLLILYSVMVLFITVGSIPLSIDNIKKDYNCQYSGGKEMAEYINKKLPNDSIIVFLQSNKIAGGSSINAYLNGKECWNPSQRDYYSYADWGIESWWACKDYDMMNNLIESDLKGGNDIYIVCGVDDEQQCIDHGLKLIYREDYAIWEDEDYALYKWKNK